MIITLQVVKNHLSNKKVIYINAHTKDISKILNIYKKKLIQFFILEICENLSKFLQMNKCIQSNTIGTNAVFDFCLKNNIKLIYSATSASLEIGVKIKFITICFY